MPLITQRSQSETKSVVSASRGEQPPVSWLRCTGCGCGSVDNAGATSPAPLLGDAVEGLPAEIEAACREARATAGLSAHTSCELMRRKILVHVAVDKGADEGKSFVEYLTGIEQSGYATPPMRPWLDLIRQYGNESTYRLATASRERALNTLAFTAHRGTIDR